MGFQLVRKPARDVVVGDRYWSAHGIAMFVEGVRITDDLVVLDLGGDQFSATASPDSPITIAEWTAS